MIFIETYDYRTRASREMTAASLLSFAASQRQDAEARRAQILTDMAALSAGDYTPEKGRQLTAKSAELDFLAAWIAAQTR